MTPTPLSYKVVKGDDMFGIALRYGIPLAVLLTANPTVNPSFLSVGTVLQIPQVEATPKPGEATPVPVQADLSTPACYLTGESGLWCLVSVSNPNEQTLENVSADVVVAAQGGGSLLQQSAFGLLYLLPPGRQAVMGAYFPGPMDGFSGASARQSGAFYQPEADVRYSEVEIVSREITIQPDGLSAKVRGRLKLAQGANTADEIWIGASAYTGDGRPAGMRRWESQGLLQASGVLDFDFLVYSLGSKISRVELLVEAHTSLESQTPAPSTGTPAN